MENNNNWFEQGEFQEVQELENQKEKTVEDWTDENKNTGKISKKNIKVEQFFQNKKLQYGIVGIIIAILGIGAYSGLKGKKKEEKIKSLEKKEEPKQVYTSREMVDVPVIGKITAVISFNKREF